MEKILETYNGLKTMNLESIDSRIEGTKEYVNGLKDETLKYLSIASEHNNIAPSKIVDTYWHELILNTRAYEQVAQKTGNFIHHIPSDKAEVEAYAKTISLYKNIFGEPKKEYWKLEAADCESFCSSGACEANCRN